MVEHVVPGAPDDYARWGGHCASRGGDACRAFTP